MNPYVSHLLPLPARELLVRAAESRREERDEKIAQATAQVKRLYPEFFQKEQ